MLGFAVYHKILNTNELQFCKVERPDFYFFRKKNSYHLRNLGRKASSFTNERESVNSFFEITSLDSFTIFSLYTKI